MSASCLMSCLISMTRLDARPGSLTRPDHRLVRSTRTAPQPGAPFDIVEPVAHIRGIGV